MLRQICEFYSPIKVVFGNGAIRVIGSELGRREAKSVFIVTDPVIVESGVLDVARAVIREHGISVYTFADVEAEPTDACVVNALGELKTKCCDTVLGVGGGSCLDVAKVVALMAMHSGEVEDLLGHDRVLRRGLPTILVPTTAGTGSEVSNVAVLRNSVDGNKVGITSTYVLPDMAIVDPELTVTLPPEITANTGLDAFSQSLEPYLSLSANPFSDLVAERAISLIWRHLPKAFQRGDIIENRYWMSFAATLSGMAFCSGKVTAVHALSYAFSGKQALPHGRAVAIMLPHVLEDAVVNCKVKLARCASLMGAKVDGLPVEVAALETVDAVKRLLQSVGVSWKLKDYGFSEADIPLLVERAWRYRGLFSEHPRYLAEDDVYGLFRRAL